MKYVLLNVLLLFSSFLLRAQLYVDAGDDTTICRTWNGFSSYVFGGSPSASGGNAPYTYSWQCSYIYSVGSNSAFLTASDFLSDTTASNPELIYSVEDPVTFYLTVEDDLGQSLTDTIEVSFSNFGTHLYEYFYNIQDGDSVYFSQIPNIGGGIEPVTYLWRPNHGLMDSTSYTNFWIKPTSTTSYYITATDAIGCIVSGTPMIDVFVGTASIEDIINGDLHKILIYPNPSNGKVTIETPQKNYKDLSVFDSNGKLVYQFANMSKLQNIDVSDLNSGTYTFTISSDKKTVSKKVVIKE